MKKYKFNATNLIVKKFEEREVKFHVLNMHGQEAVLAGFSVDNGPNVILKFISKDNDNDVAVRIYGLVNKTPKEKRNRVMDACNYLNRKIRYMKFYVDTDGDINMEYDLLVNTANESLGELAFEILIRSMRILDREYKIFAKALYTDENLEDDNEDGCNALDELLSRLEEIKSRLEARIEENESEQNDIGDASETDSEEGTDEFMTFLSMLDGEHDTEEN